MTNNNDNDNLDTPDLWGIADDIDGMLDEWDPNATEHAIAGLDREWVDKRMLAIRFKLDEIQQIEDQFAGPLDRMRAEIVALESRRDEWIETEQRAVAALTSQLQSYHRAVLADARRRGVPDSRMPKSLKSPHGTLRSRTGGKVTVKIEAGHESDVVEWLNENGLADVGVRTVPPKPAEQHPDKTGLSKLVQLGDDGSVIGVVSPDGEPMPHATYKQPETTVTVELLDGRKLS